MGKLAFIPVSVLTGILAGLIGKKLFEVVWGLIDDEEPPEAEHRETSYPKLVAAAALQGAAFRSTRAVADRASRRAFERATGQWPGEEEPDQT